MRQVINDLIEGYISPHAPFGVRIATAIVTGKLQVEGEKMRLLQHVQANRALLHCTASVDTGWSAGAAP